MRALSKTWLMVLAAMALAGVWPVGAHAATVVNGDFESGTLEGWHVHRVTEAGNWFAYQGTDAPIGSHRKPTPAAPVQPPPQGRYAATTDEANPDTLILYQDITLGAGPNQLSLLAYYNSYKPIAVPVPDTLSVDEEVLGGQKNQQFRIDVMKPSAPLESLDPADILRTLFVTEPGDPRTMPPTRLTANLSAFAGQTVRLRIANAVHEEVFNAGVDAVSISAAAPGQSASRGGKGGPILFSFGRAKVNRRSGTASLKVHVSGSGLVRAVGAPASAASSQSGEGRGPHRPIEPVTIPTPAAGTVTIHLRPTPSARRAMREGRKLRVAVTLTYMPAGARAEAASVPVVFGLSSKSGQRR
jgi:hypothetical protein